MLLRLGSLVIVAGGVAVLIASNASGQRPAAASCPLSSVTVSKPTMRADKFGSVHLTAIVAHTCAQPVGVQLKWTTYAADGSVLFSFDFWPASINNIAPNHDFPIDIPEDQVGTPVRFTVEPIAIHVW